MTDEVLRARAPFLFTGLIASLTSVQKTRRRETFAVAPEGEAFFLPNQVSREKVPRRPLGLPPADIAGVFDLLSGKCLYLNIHLHNGLILSLFFIHMSIHQDLCVCA